VIENSNKLTKEVLFSIHLYSSLCVIRDIMAQSRKNYNINPKNTTFELTLCILMILYSGVKLGMIPNSSKLKYSLYVLVF
jgi:hypothetical protein